MPMTTRAAKSKPKAKPPPVILASTSRHRKMLLNRLRISFVCAAPVCDERQVIGEHFAARALRLAEQKAISLECKYPDSLIIGGDQTIAGGGMIFDKPGTKARAIAQLKKMRGRELFFYTALSVRFGNKSTSELTTHRAIMRRASDAEILRYVRLEPSLDCAGGAQLEGLGISLLETIEGGDPTAITGISLIALAKILRNHNIAVP